MASGPNRHASISAGSSSATPQKTALVIIATGSEEIEVVTVIDVLRRAKVTGGMNIGLMPLPVGEGCGRWRERL